MRSAKWDPNSLRLSSPDLTELAIDLDLSHDQLPAWNVFVDAWQRAVSDLEMMEDIVRSRRSERAPNLPDLLKMQVQLHTVGLDAVQRVKTAVRELYGLLSLRQRGRADRLLSPYCTSFGGRRSAIPPQVVDMETRPHLVSAPRRVGSAHDEAHRRNSGRRRQS